MFTGKLHSSLTPEAVRELWARIIDLKRAYKQLARRLKDAHLCIFCVREPEGVLQFFVAKALGFGGRNAVFGFNLSARALRYILCRGLWVASSHFFDDFSQVQPAAFASSCCNSVERLFRLLGWQYKDSAEDLRPPGPVFAPLGVSMSFVEHGFAAVSNTENRRRKIMDQTQSMITAGHAEEADVISLLGVCAYAEAQTTGRSGACFLKAVRNTLKQGPSSAALFDALSALREHTMACVPRFIRLSRHARPAILLTDAAADEASVTLGACLFDSDSGVREYFGCQLHGPILEEWRAEGNSVY
jgi:hypothetical protein